MARLREFAIAFAGRPDPDAWSGPAFFVGIVDRDDDGLTAAVLPVDSVDFGAGSVGPGSGPHPSELLPYLDVPADWLALGVVAFGWARSIDDRHQPRRRAHSVDLYDRRG